MQESFHYILYYNYELLVLNLKDVPLFNQMYDRKLDAICERLKHLPSSRG
jgi:hypothetical protein